ncbi:MAG: alpha/beta hydrolase family protein [Aestuariibacter sp.]
MKNRVRGILASVAFYLCFSGSAVNAITEARQSEQFSVASQELNLFDQKRQRPIKVTVWYPEGKGCQKAQICLAQESKTQQPIVFSHGAMGAAKGYSWIGRNLASHGYITLGINHFGESWVYGKEQVNPKTVTQFWLRPQDISATLDMLSQRSDIFNYQVNLTAVTAIGHSSGAATALALAGMQLEWKNAASYCEMPAHQADRSCGYSATLDTQSSHDFPTQQNWQDDRINKIVALDPAMGHMINENSVANINSHVLLISSKHNDFLIHQNHGAQYAARLPVVISHELDKGEGHFVYLDTCTHQYRAMGVSLCEDRDGVDRDKVHQQILPMLLVFLSEPER